MSVLQVEGGVQVPVQAHCELVPREQGREAGGDQEDGVGNGHLGVEQQLVEESAPREEDEEGGDQGGRQAHYAH